MSEITNLRYGIENITCKKCGYASRLAKDEKYCKVCGEKIKEES